jgi:DNA repair exonuclease SbcCD ATPase subunit
LIIFNKLRYKNILSTGNIFTELRLNEYKTSLVVGKNGSGKTTFLDALVFVLYGKPHRKINKPQLVNSITKKDLLVEVEFDIKKDSYKIIRGLKPVVFEIFKNGELLNQDAASRDYQDYLEKNVLKINYKAFCQVVVLSSASFTPFMQLTTQARREIIEDLLDLQIFSIMNLLLKERVLETSKAIEGNQNQRTVLINKLNIMKTHYENIQQTNEISIQEKKSKIKQAKKDIEILQKEYDNISENGLMIKSEIEKLIDTKEKSKQIDNFLFQLETKKNTFQEVLNFIHTNDNCPVCKQDIDEKFKNKKVKDNLMEIKKIETSFEKIKKSKKQVEEDLKKLNSLVSSVQDLNLKLSQHNFKISNLNSNIKDWFDEIKKIEKNNTFISKEELEKIENDIDVFSETYKNLLEDKEVNNIAVSLLKDGGIKSRIIKQYIPVINKLINKYLASMDFFVNFDLDENFEETIKSRGRDDFSYMSFSEGEKMRIDLATLFTWRAIARMRSSVNTNILIMDEIFDSSLDVNGADDFLNILKSITKDNNTFVISHRTDQMIDKFDHVIKFEKIRNFSHLETS